MSAGPPAAETAQAPAPRTFRLLLEYDGAGFEGWQLQPGGRRTVQGCLEATLEGLVGHPVRVRGAGRTDAGVHARGQVAAARLATRLGPAELHRALDALLPPDLAVRELAPAADGFDPRRAARGKLYRYRVWNGRWRSPLRAAAWHHVPRPLDLAAMERAARDLRGRHDFASFRAAGSSVRTSVRSLRRLDLAGHAGDELELWFEGDGFLRHMVRNLVGTLLQVGLGRRPADGMPGLLAARDRSRAGPTAPARGLCLMRVDLEEGAGAGEVAGAPARTPETQS